MRRLLFGCLQSMAALLVVVTIVWLLLAHTMQLKLLAVQTGSMCPSFCQGDALLLRQAAPEQVRPGAVVAYRSSRSPNELITHRLTYNQGGRLQTKGDALGVPDPPVRASLLVGRVVAILPGFGRVLDDARSLPALIVCVYLPVLAVIYTELQRFEGAWKRRSSYRLIR